MKSEEGKKMIAKVTKPKRLDNSGNGDYSSDRNIFTTTLKQWRQKLGYYSIFAAVPAIRASRLTEARSEEAKKTEASVAGRLRRDPDPAGFQNWLDKLNTYGNYIDAEMVKSFIVSPEYRARFGQP